MNLTPESSIPRLGRLACVSIFAVALVARLAATAAAGFETLRFGDARAYLFAAQELVRTGHYPLKTEPFYFRAPGYPVFLVAATLGHPDRIALAKLANCVLGAVAALLLASLSVHIFSRRNAAIVAGVAAAVAPGFVYLSTDVQSEPLFLVLLLASGWLLLVSADRPSSNLAFLAGAALALAALTRPTALVLGPLLAAPLADHRRPPRVRAHLAASALLGFALALGPWTLRNAVVYRDFVPVNDAAGSAFYQGNSDWMVRFYRLKSPAEYRDWSAASFADLERQTRAAEAVQPNSPSAKSRYFLRKTFEERRGDPAGWVRLLLRKAFDWMRPYPNPLFWPAWAVWSVGAFYTVLTVLAIVGFLKAPRSGVRAFSILFLAMTMAVHVAIIVVWRYRIPYWDPVLLLYAAAAIPYVHVGLGSRGGGGGLAQNARADCRGSGLHRRGPGPMALLLLSVPEILRGAKHGRRAVLLRQLPGDRRCDLDGRRVQPGPRRSAGAAPTARVCGLSRALRTMGRSALPCLAPSAAGPSWGVRGVSHHSSSIRLGAGARRSPVRELDRGAVAVCGMGDEGHCPREPSPRPRSGRPSRPSAYPENPLRGPDWSDRSRYGPDTPHLPRGPASVPGRHCVDADRSLQDDRRAVPVARGLQRTDRVLGRS